MVTSRFRGAPTTRPLPELHPHPDPTFLTSPLQAMPKWGVSNPCSWPYLPCHSWTTPRASGSPIRRSPGTYCPLTTCPGLCPASPAPGPPVGRVGVWAPEPSVALCFDQGAPADSTPQRFLHPQALSPSHRPLVHPPDAPSPSRGGLGGAHPPLLACSPGSLTPPSLPVFPRRLPFLVLQA